MSASMMNHSRREKLTVGPPFKRKERDCPAPLDVPKPSPLTTKKLAKPSPHHRHPPAAKAVPPADKASPHHQPLSNNHLLAGYLAHEFLSKGTLFGEPWDPARAEAVPVSAAGTSRLNQNGKRRRGKAEAEREVKESSAAAGKYERYMEVADLLRTDGAHIPGVVNPTQLGRFLQL